MAKKTTPKDQVVEVVERPKAYYARPISIDGSQQAERDVELIHALGFDAYPVGLAKEEALAHYQDYGMATFRPYVRQCRALFFRAFPDGSIGAGVAKELEWAQEAGIPVVEIPRQIPRRVLSVDQTREMLAELGQR